MYVCACVCACKRLDVCLHAHPCHLWQGFYTKNTDFNLSFALLNPSSDDYTKLIRDLDVIATQLKKLAAVGSGLVMAHVFFFRNIMHLILNGFNSRHVPGGIAVRSTETTNH